MLCFIPTLEHSVRSTKDKLGGQPWGLPVAE